MRGSKTGEIVDRDRIVKGYEFERERYVTSIDDELNDLRIGSSKIIYRELAAETLRVIEYAMARSSKVGRGRVTISSRERPVPRRSSLRWSADVTLRSADEVRPTEFGAKAKPTLKWLLLPKR